MTDAEQRLMEVFTETVGAAGFEQWLDEWGGKVERRTMNSKVVDVTVDFVNDSVEIADVLAPNSTVRLASIRAAKPLTASRGR